MIRPVSLGKLMICWRMDGGVCLQWGICIPRPESPLLVFIVEVSYTETITILMQGRGVVTLWVRN